MTNKETESGKLYWGFQYDLKGYILEKRGEFIPKWQAFASGYTPEQLKSGLKKVKARLYTQEEINVRFKQV